MVKAVAEKRVFKFPKKLGTCVDRLQELQGAMDELSTEYKAAIAPLEEEYAALESHLIDTIPKDELEGAVGRTAAVTIERTSLPTVKDWPKFYAYVKKTEAWELLQKRLSITAFRERWNNKDTVPGTEMFIKLQLKLKSRN